MELSSKRKIAGKYKSNVSNYQYRSLSFLAEKVVSPVSFGTKVCKLYVYDTDVRLLRFLEPLSAVMSQKTHYNGSPAFYTHV